MRNVLRGDRGRWVFRSQETCWSLVSTTTITCRMCQKTRCLVSSALWARQFSKSSTRSEEEKQKLRRVWQTTTQKTTRLCLVTVCAAHFKRPACWGELEGSQRRLLHTEHGRESSVPNLANTANVSCLRKHKQKGTWPTCGFKLLFWKWQC